VTINGKEGYIDKKGKVIIKPRFISASNFIHGLAKVQIGYDEESRWGYIDKRGRYVWGPTN
jgi:hypothetical protein